MHAVVKMGLALGLALGIAQARAQAPAWRPAEAGKAAPVITLGRPVPLDAPPAIPTAYTPSIELGTPRPLVRAQSAELQPPIPPPPPPTAFPAGAPGAEEAYNCGVATGAKGGGGLFSRCWDGCKEWFHGVPGSVQGIFQQGTTGQGIFQSDHRYDDN